MLKSFLESKKAVEFIEGEVTKIETKNNTIQSVEYTDRQKQKRLISGFDKYVVSSGIGSVNIGDMLGLRVPIYGFKGHSLNVYVAPEKMIKGNYIFAPENLAVARVGINTTKMVRVTGYADVDGNNLTTLQFRKNILINFAKRFLGDEHYDDSKAHHWVGLRPVTADDCAIIGKSSKISNLFWNTGQGARGITHCPSSCLLLATLMTGEHVPKELHPESYSPSRFDL